MHLSALAMFGSSLSIVLPIPSPILLSWLISALLLAVSYVYLSPKKKTDGSLCTDVRQRRRSRGSPLLRRR